MIKLVFLLQTLVICLSCAGTEVQRSESSADAGLPRDSFGLLALPNSRIAGLSVDTKPVENTVRVNVGHQSLQLKTHYQEKR